MKSGQRSCIFITAGKHKFYVSATSEEVGPGVGQHWPEFSPLRRRARFWKTDKVESWRGHFAALLPEFAFEAEPEVTVAGLPE